MTLRVADTGPVLPPAPPGAPQCGGCTWFRHGIAILDPTTGCRTQLGSCHRGNDARSHGVRWEDEHCAHHQARSA